MTESDSIDALPVFSKDGYTAKYSTWPELLDCFVGVIVFNDDDPGGRNQARSDRAYSLEYLADNLTEDPAEILEDAWNQWVPGIKDRECKDVVRQICMTVPLIR